MLGIIYDTVLQKNIFFNNKKNNFNIINESHLNKSVFNELQKSVLNKRIEFENFSTENKKKDGKNIIYTNLVINSLLDILNKTNKDSHNSNLKNIKNNNIQKKK